MGLPAPLLLDTYLHCDADLMGGVFIDTANDQWDFAGTAQQARGLTSAVAPSSGCRRQCLLEA